MKKYLFLMNMALTLAAFLCANGGYGETCLECHDDTDLTLERDGLEVSLSVSLADFEGTAHEDFDCMDCHAGLDEDDLPHAESITPAVVSCLDCHDGLETSHAFHGGFADLDSETVLEDGIRCSDCHDTHKILLKSDPGFPFAERNLTRACGVCHELESIGYLHSAHARSLEEGSVIAPTCLGCHTEKYLTPDEETADSGHKVQMVELCLHCHVENPEVSGQTLYGSPFFTSFEDSVHGKALYSGNADAPGCVDCHGSHYVARASDNESNVSRGHIVSQCARCHEQPAKDYLHSIHADVLAKGYLDAPVCTDCHGEHNILAHGDPDSPVAPANLAVQVCGDCHGSVRLSERYSGLETDRLSTFEDSFHGLATRGGAVEAVNCASCHGYHDVRAGADPESLVHPDNLAATCGNCHEGANERFAMGKVHVSVDTTSGEPVLYWIATVYVWAIFAIIGGMVLHNLMDFIHKVRRKATSHRAESASIPIGIPHRLYLRMTVNERIQHGTLALSFIILVLTGFMLKYPEAWWVVGLRNLNSNIFEFRGLVHRIAGVAMCLAGIWHISYLFITKRGHQLCKDLAPRKKDLADMFGVLRYNLGLAPSKPLFERFSYMEKAEYWALIWGSIIMTVTGFLLWFENSTIGLLTKLGFDISLTVHFYEAVLATLSIIVWHFYFVIFNPDVYPMNLSWLTGKMSEEEMSTEHALELRRIVEAEKKAAEKKVAEKADLIDDA